MAKRKNLKPPGKCIWCGNGSLTKEHIWSEWTHELVPPIPNGSHTRVTTTSSPAHPLFKSIEDSLDRQGSTNTVQLRVVCGSCNSGWMSGIDTVAKPVLSPLIMGQPLVITEPVARLVATWIAMKAMVAEHARRRDVTTSQAERDYLRLNKQAPPHWQIWIAHHDGQQKWRSGYARHSQAITLKSAGPPPVREDGTFAPNTQSVTFGIGNLLFQVISTAVPEIGFDVPFEFRKHLHRIWPFTGSFLWPPGIILKERTVDSIAYAFDHIAHHPNVSWVI